MGTRPTTPVSAPPLERMRAARALLAPVLGRAPIVPHQAHGPGHTGGGRGAAAQHEAQLFLALEVHQPIGSFKLRGIWHAVARMTPEERGRGLSTVSAGNTAKALAYSAARFGVPARSLMPEGAPKTKVEAVAAMGATPVLVPTVEVFRFLQEKLWLDEPYAFVHPWIDPEVLVGHGTLGLEIVEALPDIDSVYIPVGGGGLMGGVGSALRALRPDVRLIAVEPEGCPALHTARAAGKPVRVDCKTICDGVAVPYITDEMFPLLMELVDDVVLVSEERVRAAVRKLALDDHVVAEGSGALAFAAALATPLAVRGKTLCPITGGCIDAGLLAEILAG